MFEMRLNSGTTDCIQQPLFLTDRQDEDLKMAYNDVDQTVYVYKVTCTVNGKIYIGVSTRRVDRRWAEHVREALKSSSTRILIHAIRKYGVDAFKVEQIYEAVNVREACAVERAMIAAYGSMVPTGYNMTTGGEGSVGRQLSNEAKKQVSDTVSQLWSDDEYRTRMVASFQNRVIPESHKEHLRKLAADMKGKARNPEAVEKGRQKLIGHAVSEETRAKMSAKWADPKYKAAVIAKLTSPEVAARRVKKMEEAREKGAFVTAGSKNREKALARWADPLFRAKMAAIKKKPYKKRHKQKEI